MASEQNADVIIVGAGSFGCNAAWHLRQRGLDVLVLDRGSGPAAEATRAAAGFVAKFSFIHHAEWDAPEWEMQRYGIDFYSALADRCGQDIGFCASGIAYIYQTAEAWNSAQPAIEVARSFGTQLEILSAERAAELLPEIRFESTAAIVFDPEAIRLRADDTVAALAGELQQSGVRFEFGVQVQELLSASEDSQRVVGVLTDHGVRKASQVVVAAGAWSRPLLSAAGVMLPAKPVVVARYTTRPLAGISRGMPMLMFSDSVHRFWIREERGGLLIGGADPRPLPADRCVDLEDPPHAGELPAAHAVRVREYVRGVEHIFPALASAEIDEVRAGLPCYSDNRLFVCTSVVGSAGLHVMAACNEAGITHGPALGRHMSELIVDGDTRLERARFDIRRGVATASIRSERGDQND